MPAPDRAKPGDLVEATIVNLDEAAPDAGRRAPDTAVAPPAGSSSGASATAAAEPQEPVRFVLGQGRALPELESR